jgi:sugar phosphate isomerase/epimerase
MSGRVALFSSAVPGWDAERVIATARALGLDAVEWGVGPGQALAGPDDGEAVARRCREAGVAVAGLAVQDRSVTLATPRTGRAYVALARELGAPHVRFWAPDFGGESLAAAQRRARAGVDRLVEAGEAARVAVLVETSPVTIAPSAELALTLVAHHPPARAGVLFDPGNTAIEGHLAPALAVALLGRHLRHVHVKNVAWTRRGGAWRWSYADLDRGIVEWPAVLDALAIARYRGRLSIDHLARRPTEALLRAECERLGELLASY